MVKCFYIITKSGAVWKKKKLTADDFLDADDGYTVILNPINGKEYYLRRWHDVTEMED